MEDMTRSTILTITSLLSSLLASIHFSQDIVLGIEPGGTTNFNGILIVAVNVCAAVMLTNRRWAHAIVLLYAIAGTAIPHLHMQGVGLVGGRAARADGQLFWVWTLLALGITSAVSAVLAAQGLWRLRKGATVTAQRATAGSSV